MRDMKESNPPGSSVSRFLSLLGRLWQRLIGRAAPADKFLRTLEIRYMREDNPPRSNFSRFLSLLSRFWERLIGRATPADEFIIELKIPKLELETPKLNLQMERLNFDMPVQNTFNLTNIVARLNTRELELLRTERYMDPIRSEINLGPRFFQNMQNDWPWREEQFFRHQQQTARAEAYHWWWHHQNSFPALPDPEDFRNSSKLAGNPNLDIPEAFICAITREIMTTPVYDPNFPQQRYDRDTIERWLTDHPTNPCTRSPLTVANLVADDDLKARIDEFVANALQTSVALIPRNG